MPAETAASVAQAPVEVLYIHPAAAFGGASRSLLELLRAFPPGTVSAHALLPAGSAARLLQELGVRLIETKGITQFDNTRIGYYRGLRWLVLLRELCFLPFTLAGLLRARRAWPHIQLVHVNEVTALLPIVLSKLMFRVPVVVHVRSVQREARDARRSRLVWAVLARFATRIIAIDETVRRSLPDSLACAVVHNGFAPDARVQPDSALAQSLDALATRPSIKIGMVGVLLAVKGVRELMQAAALCLQRNLNVEFVIVGENPRQLRGVTRWLLQRASLATDMRAEIEALVARHRLQGRVHVLGFTPAIQAVYERIDVLCFPSHLDAVGRPVFEAAWFKVPSIVALRSPLPDTFVPQETGLCVAPGDVAALADAIEHFVTRPEEITRMGQGAYELARRNFDIHTTAARTLAIYRAAVAGDAKQETRQCAS